MYGKALTGSFTGFAYDEHENEKNRWKPIFDEWQHSEYKGAECPKTDNPVPVSVSIRSWSLVNRIEF